MDGRRAQPMVAIAAAIAVAAQINVIGTICPGHFEGSSQLRAPSAAQCRPIAIGSAAAAVA